MSNIPRLVLEKQLRDGHTYKHVEIAEEIGISSTMVAHFLRDKVNISNIAFSTALAWSDWLECDVRELATPIDAEPEHA